MSGPDENMIDAYRHMAAVVEGLVKNLPESGQLLIGIAGPPGGGKSTTARALQALVPRSIVVPMDGYHYTKKQLDQFPDPVEARARRGAHWTFDGEAFVAALLELKSKKSRDFPEFVHGVGDPEDGAIHVLGPEQHQVVIVEGNYLTLDISPWDQLTSILDYTFFMDCPLEAVEQRVARRHMEVNGNSFERAWERVTVNDSPNAQLVLASKGRASEIVQSR